MPAEIPPFASKTNTHLDRSKFVISQAQYQALKRPRLYIIGGASFDFPLGTEGFRIFGSATLAIHKYVGDRGAVVQVMHLDERRIELTGVFPGDGGAENMRRLMTLLVTPSPSSDYKRLELPGILSVAIPVEVENYDFSHSEGDYTKDVVYSVTFVRVVPPSGQRSNNDIGGGGPDSGSASPPAPGATTRGDTSRRVVVSDALRTLRTISNLLYGSAEKWKDLYDLNVSVLTNAKTWAPAEIPPLHQMPTKPLPLGLVLNY